MNYLRWSRFTSSVQCITPIWHSSETGPVQICVQNMLTVTPTVLKQEDEMATMLFNLAFAYENYYTIWVRPDSNILWPWYDNRRSRTSDKWRQNANQKNYLDKILLLENIVWKMLTIFHILEVVQTRIQRAHKSCYSKWMSRRKASCIYKTIITPVLVAKHGP